MASLILDNPKIVLSQLFQGLKHLVRLHFLVSLLHDNLWHSFGKHWIHLSLQLCAWKGFKPRWVQDTMSRPNTSEPRVACHLGISSLRTQSDNWNGWSWDTSNMVETKWWQRLGDLQLLPPCRAESQGDERAWAECCRVWRVPGHIECQPFFGHHMDWGQHVCFFIKESQPQIARWAINLPMVIPLLKSWLILDAMDTFGAMQGRDVHRRLKTILPPRARM